jgi:hypothetical protein
MPATATTVARSSVAREVLASGVVPMKFQRAAVLLASLASMAGALPAGAANTQPVWHAAKVVSLPNGGTGLPRGYLPALSCPSSGSCSAGGAYSDASGHTQGLLLTMVRGTWRAPTKLSPPANAGQDPGVTITALSCGSPGNCGAVGGYQDATGNALSFVAREVNAKWLGATEVALPNGAAVNGQNSSVHSVACASAGNCSAVGTYLDSASPISGIQAFTLDEVRGVWGSARQIAVPSDANANPFVAVGQVACPSAGNCSAVGSYIDTNNVTRGLLLNERGGSWQSGIALALPGDANAFAGASLSELSCASAGNCTALGTYTSNTGGVEGLTTVESHGAWTRGVGMKMPAGAAANPHVFFYGFSGLSCPSIGDCSAGGQYLDSSDLYQGFFINEVNGAWQAASALALPAGSRAAGRNGGVVAVSCRSAGSCSAGAAYLDGTGNYQALVVNEVATVWRTGKRIALPNGATTVGVDGGVYGLVCSTSTSCTATGSYQSSSTNYQGFTVATN